MQVYYYNNYIIIIIMNNKKYSSENSDSNIQSNSDIEECSSAGSEPKVIKINRLKNKPVSKKKIDDKKILQMLHELVEYSDNENNTNIKKTNRNNCKQLGNKKFNINTDDDEKSKIINEIEEKTKVTQEKLKKFKTIVQKEQTKEIIGSIGENVIAPIQTMFIDMLKASGPGVVMNGVMPLVSDRLRIAMEEARDKRYVKMLQKHEQLKGNKTRINISKHRNYNSSEDRYEKRDKKNVRRYHSDRDSSSDRSSSPSPQLKSKNMPQIDIQNPTYVQNLINLLQQQASHTQNNNMEVEGSVNQKNNTSKKHTVTATISSNGSRKIII